MTPSIDLEGSHHLPASPLETEARDRRVVKALEAAFAGRANTLKAYITRWRSFAHWCDATGLNPLPAAPVTVVKFLETQAGTGSSFATLRHTASVITRVHELAGHPSPCKDQSVRKTLKRLPSRLVKPRAEVGALTPDNCYRIFRRADYPRKRGRGQETEAHAAQRGRVDVALVYVLSEAGLSAFEASQLTWGDVHRWRDDSGRITVRGSLTDGRTQDAIVAVTGETMDHLDAIRPSDAAADVKVIGLSASQVLRRVRAAAEAAGIDNWEAFNGSSGRVGLVRRLVANSAPNHVVERQARKMQHNGIVGRYTSGECAAEALPYL